MVNVSAVGNDYAPNLISANPGTNGTTVKLDALHVTQYHSTVKPGSEFTFRSRACCSSISNPSGN
jgi:hypothetical protein